MASVRIEFLIEPFSEGAPGPHVLAAIEAVGTAGFEPEIGPFGTIVEVPVDRAPDVIRDVVAAALDGGATRVGLQIERSAGNKA
jgi:uncharacterized protein YqgV (UPF0045/DUF77 family)